MHECPGCGRADISDNYLACRMCWYRLPPAMRSEIWRTYGKPALYREYVTARSLALTWYRRHPTAE